MKSNLKRVVMWILIGLAVVLYFKFGIVIPEKPSKIRIDQMHSSTVVTYLGESVQEYMKKNNGEQPSRLADLIENPELCSDIQMIFRYPYHSVSQKNRVVTNDVCLAEKYSDYVLSTNFNSDILVHEKHKLWPDGSVAVYLKGQGTVRMTNKDFQKLLENHE